MEALNAAVLADVKPMNILMVASREGEVPPPSLRLTAKLCDFGSYVVSGETEHWVPGQWEAGGRQGRMERECL